MSRQTLLALVAVALVAGLLALQGFLRMQAAAGSSERIVLWHAYIGREADALLDLVRKYNADPQLNGGVKVDVLPVAFGNFPDKLTNALPRGQGPDVFIYAHDRLEDWKAKGLIAPVDFWVQPDEVADYQPEIVLDAFIRDHRLYGFPLTVKNLALYVRRLPDGTDVASRIRELQTQGAWTFESFYKLARELTRPCPWNTSLKCYGLGVQADDAYHHAMWVHAAGGAFLDAQGLPDVLSDAHRKAAEWSRKLSGAHRDAVVPPELSYPLMSDLFIKGEIAMVISGPWFQSQLDPQKTPYTVLDFPMVDGHYPAPFLSLEGLYLSARSRRPEAAVRLMKFLAGAHSAEVRARAAGQVPIRRTVADAMRRECETNRDCPFERFFYGQFLQVAQKGVVMPASQNARMMWPPYSKALAAIIRRNEDIYKALREADWEISRYVGACAGGDR